METRILRLRLSRPLRYLAAGNQKDFDEAPDRAEFFSLSKAIDDHGSDGPLAASPLPAPTFRGVALAGDGGAGESPSGGQAMSVEIGEDCAIAQFPGEADARECMEAFIREAWWAGAELRGPLTLRRIREDGSESLQWISPARFPASPSG